MLSVLFVLLTISNPAHAKTTVDQVPGAYWYDDLPQQWSTPGTCKNLWMDCMNGLYYGQGNDDTCGYCHDQCQDALVDPTHDDVPPATYTVPEYCGDIDRTDCEREKMECDKKCDAQMECQMNDQLPNCKACHEQCETYWPVQCELKRTYDLNRNSIDVTECLDWTKWPEPDAEICCEEMVWWGAVDNCVSGVQWGCYEPCFSHFDWPWSAIELCRDKCDCYYGTGRRNGKVGTREECEAIGQSTGLFTVDLTGNPTEMMSAFIAGILLCIAGLLCWAICVQSRKTAMPYGKIAVFDVDSENENL